MSNEKEKLLFTTTDPHKYQVVLSSERYEHITGSENGHQAHCEFTPDELRQTIEDPIFIYKGNRPNNDVYISRKCSKYPYLYLKVGVSTYNNCGDVRTAYLDKTITGGISEEEGSLKYANYKSEL